MFSSFGTQQQQPGQAAAAQPSLFGGFGQNNNQQQQQQQNPAPGGGLFGAQQQQQPQQSSLFGGFGSQNQQPATGSLFGNTNNPNNAAPAPGTSLFGGTAQSQQQNQPAAGGLFGASTNQSQNPQQNLFGTTNQTTSGTGLFGGSVLGGQQQQQQQQPQQQQNSGLFGASKPAGSMFNSNVGQQQSNTSTQGVPQNVAVAGSTKFNDLPDDFRGLIENIDSMIQKQTNIGRELNSKELGRDAENCGVKARQLGTMASATVTTLETDGRFIADLKLKCGKALQDNVFASSIILGWTHPNDHGQSLITYAEFPFQYFSILAKQLQERLQQYKVIVEQIERKLSSAADREQYSPQSIAATLRAQHSTFMSLAGRTAELHNQLQRLKDVYRQRWQTQNASARDPFEVGGSTTDGLSVSGLRVR
ncbi:hypothetical protein FRB94_004601 [Tulasnella sp. JGI-2019a]|nr:hypothetical protein FRB94_004601 [Tulasnella sp. JGI-2019a]KAG9003429.1 hypothetical protein FRB93_011052 [Tulasnella sp. JGI-2019a]KAG9024896.1 hypothetical protein FRB95_010931 [Tulasnella sp. JGI-2019a]